MDKRTKFHACLMCKSAKNISSPISLTNSGLYLTFSCADADHVESHLFNNESQPMIYDFEFNECWVDASSHIPLKGCINFKLSRLINKETFEKFNKKTK